MGRGGGGEGNIQQEEFQNKSQQFKIARTSFGVHSPTTYWSYFIFYFKYLSYSSQQFLDRPKVRRHCSYATCCGQAHSDPKSKHRHVRQPLSCSFCLLQLQFRLQFLSFCPCRGSDKGLGFLVFRIRAEHLPDKIYYCATCCFSTWSASGRGCDSQLLGRSWSCVLGLSVYCVGKVKGTLPS